MIKAKLITFTSGKYRKTEEIIVPTQEAADDLLALVKQLQRYFDVSLELHYESDARTDAPKPSGRKKVPIDSPMFVDVEHK
ncbi:MAG: hypothetical protein NC218_01735 [Acetobacter sp.]|nr:hypothetical protein [Acetobacter sp.]